MIWVPLAICGGLIAIYLVVMLIVGFVEGAEEGWSRGDDD